MPEFDPYRKWLGIATKDQPPNHYRLLGIDLFESDREVIAVAAKRQAKYLRTFKTANLGPLVQRLLDEVHAAYVCLSDPAKRQAYDALLREKLAPQTPPPLPAARAMESPLAENSIPPMGFPPVHKIAIRGRKKHTASWLPWFVVAVGAVLVVAILLLVGGNHGRQDVATAPKSDAKSLPAKPESTHPKGEPQPKVKPPQVGPRPKVKPPQVGPRPKVELPMVEPRPKAEPPKVEPHPEELQKIEPIPAVKPDLWPHGKKKRQPQEAQMPSLIEALDSPSPLDRGQAAQQIGHMRLADEAALRALVKATGDLDEDVRAAAVKAIREIGPKAATVSTVVPAVIEQFRAAKKTAVREGLKLEMVPLCLYTLGVLGKESEAAVDALTVVLRGAQAGRTKPLTHAVSGRDSLTGWWRVNACGALAVAGPNARSSLPVLLDVLNMAAKDPNHAESGQNPLDADDMYFTATAALGAIGDERALPALRRYQQGKGLWGKGDSFTQRARVAADTAVRQIEQAKPKTSKPKE